ncbi:hypothetical protein L1887_34316 [Cichorium endivia]|nr:hypothetical protein L1887_34316 [Cichorium endivia]
MFPPPLTLKPTSSSYDRLLLEKTDDAATVLLSAALLRRCCAILRRRCCAPFCLKNLCSQIDLRLKMDETMKQFQEKLIEIETEAENLFLARHQLVENDRMRNGNREALTALRKRARTTKTSLPSPFELLMKEVDQSTPLVKEICPTCGNHDSMEKTWMMFPGTDIFSRVPFHAAHTILEKDQTKLDFDVNKLQSYVKEKSFLISEQGVLADKIGPGVLKSLVTLQDKPR